MSLADKIFVDMCRDIIENGTFPFFANSSSAALLIFHPLIQNNRMMKLYFDPTLIFYTTAVTAGYNVTPQFRGNCF